MNKWELGQESTETEKNIRQIGLGVSSPSPLGQQLWYDVVQCV